MSEREHRQERARGRRVVVGLVVLALVLGAWWGDLSAMVRAADGLAHVWWGPVVGVALYVVAVVALVPGSAISLMYGALFGPLVGGVVVWLGATLGAMITFAMGRTVARDAVDRWVGARPGWRAIEAAVARRGFRVVLAIRLSPILPFNVLNYALGTSPVSWRASAAATALGIIPGVAVVVSVGHTAGALARVASGAPASGGVLSGVQLALTGAGVLSTLGLAAWLGRVARQALDASLDVSSDASQEARGEGGDGLAR